MFVSVQELVLDDGHQAADEGDDASDENEPEADSDLECVGQLDGGSEDGPGLHVEEESADDNDEGSDQGDDAEDVVDRGELLGVHDGGDDHEDEGDDTADQGDKGNVLVVDVVEGAVLVVVDIHSGVVVGAENSGIQGQPVKENTDDEDDRADNSDDSKEI